MGFVGRDQPATNGEGYNQESLETAGEAELVVSAGLETRSVIIIAHPGNSGNIYLGWDDDVSSTTGFPLEAGVGIAVDLDANEQAIWFDADNASDTVAWMATN